MIVSGYNLRGEIVWSGPLDDAPGMAYGVREDFHRGLICYAPNWSMNNPLRITHWRVNP